MREDSRLGARVFVERGVAVHVIRGDVEHDRAEKLERGGRLQLEARELEHVQIGNGLLEQVERGLAEVAAGEHGQSRAFGHARDQARHRALAVGAGDADHRRLGGAREQLDVAQHLDAAAARLGDDRLLRRHPGRQQHLRSALEQRHIERAEAQVDALGEIAELGESGWRRTRVGRGRGDAVPREIAQARGPRLAQAHDDRALHRIFNVARPVSISRKLMIQKRTITFGSLQPLSSK